MKIRRFALLLSVLALAASPVALPLRPARGDAGQDEARKAQMAALARGRALWNQAWSEGGKTCASCHGPGPNQMRGMRLKRYPTYDRIARRVITGQQKLNQMITSQGRGAALELGSDDLNALEAYVSSLR